MTAEQPNSTIGSAYDVAREDLLEHLTSVLDSDRSGELADTFEARTLQRAAVALRTYADEMDAGNEAFRWEGSVHFRDAAGQLEYHANELLPAVLAMDEAQRRDAARAEVAVIASIGGSADNVWADGYVSAVKELRTIFQKYGLELPPDH